MADMLGTGLSSLRALQRALDTTAHNIANVSTEGYTRQRVEFATRQPQAYGSNWIGSGVDAVSRASRLRPVPVAAGAQLERHAGASRRLRRAGRAPRQPARRHQQRSECLAAEFHRRDQRSFQHAELDFGAPGAAGRGQCPGRAAQELRHAPARNVRRRRLAPRGRGRRNQRARAGHRAPQWRHQPSPFSRPASRPTTCSISATRSSTSCRRRSASPSSPKASPRSMCSSAPASRWCWAPRPRRSPRSTDPLDAGTRAAGAEARHRAPWTSRAASPAARSADCSTGAADARSGPQRAGPHHAGRRLAGQRPASRGHGPHRRAGRQFLQRGRGRRGACHDQHHQRGGHGHAHESRRAHRQRLRGHAHRHRLHGAAPGHGRLGDFHRHGHRASIRCCSTACRYPWARAWRRATSSSFIPRAMPSRASTWRSPIRRASRRRRRLRTAAASTNTGTGTISQAEVLTARRHNC